MLRWLRLFPAFVLAISATLAAPTAMAGEEDSKTFFAQGRELRLQGRCVDAVIAFKKALDAQPQGLGALRNIAECEEQLSRFASARRSYWDLRVAVLKSPEEKYEGWDKQAEEAFARLALRVPKVVIKVRGTQTPSVRINGRPLDRALLETEIEQDVGELEAVLEDGSSSPPSKKLRLEEGKVYEVVLESAGGQAVQPKQPEPVEPASSKGPSPLLITGGVAFGLTGLSLGGLIGAAVVRQGALDQIEQQCPTLSGCSSALVSERDKGDTASVMVNVFAVGTGVFAALGIGLTTAGVLLPQKSSDGTALRIEPALSDTGGFLSVGGSFF